MFITGPNQLEVGRIYRNTDEAPVVRNITTEGMIHQEFCFKVLREATLEEHKAYWEEETGKRQAYSSRDRYTYEIQAD